MSQFLYLVPVLLFLSSVLGSSMATAPPLPAATLRAPQLTVAVTAQSIRAGETQTLQVHLDQTAERLATMVLIVTYPNGVTERSLHSARGREATITWPVPRNAGSGNATFSLAAHGCACGQEGTAPPPTKLDSAVTGIFYIGEAR